LLDRVRLIESFAMIPPLRAAKGAVLRSGRQFDCCAWSREKCRLKRLRYMKIYECFLCEKGRAFGSRGDAELAEIVALRMSGCGFGEFGKKEAKSKAVLGRS
jgi:hypothetical protein